MIFQPAEEGGGGGLAMVQDGMMDKFGIREVYGLHNAPNIPLGDFAIRKGGIMAAADTFEITVKGKGSHAAQPHLSVDPVLTAAYIIVALQAIASRETDPLKSVVVSVTTVHGGDAYNVIPMDVKLTETVRTLDRKCGTWPQSAWWKWRREQRLPWRGRRGELPARLSSHRQSPA